ncbi:MAG: alpha-amylase family glycosyl hydrolase [Paludibacteraceae bacterium]|nr:alpha-amylase family glycosyl hydrolase [Paludibacteraceae bacterium]
MKKLLFPIATLLITVSALAQITTNPAKIEEGYTGNVTITFNPTGTGMAGQTTCYAHIGVTTKETGAWQCAPSKWGDNADKYKMTKSGSNWVLNLGNMYDYFDCATAKGKTFTAINVVFRTESIKEGEVKQTGDLIITIYPKGFVEKDPETKARPSGIDEGIYYNGNKVTVSLYTADKSGNAAQNVYLLGDFNSWSYSNDYHCYKDGAYYWFEFTNLQAGKEYALQYAVKRGGNYFQVADPYSQKVLHPDDQWEPKKLDPSIPKYPAAGDGYVTLLQPGKAAYNWSDATKNFKRPNKDNLVIYELWVYNFAPERSYRSVTQRLDYLQNLGINALELMPVSEFEGNISWGYNPTCYFAADKTYGKESDLKQLIDECHKRGIAVIIDMVFNHATGLSPLEKLYTSLATNPYFNTKCPHSGGVFEDFNHDFAGTKKYFSNVLQYWLKEYKVDGFRMDLAHGFCGPNCTNRKNNIQGYYNAIKSVSSDAYFILEYWESDRTSYPSLGIGVWENTNNAYMQTAMGWLHEGDSFSEANYDGRISYCSSHDEQRPFWKAKKYGNGDLKTSEASRTARTPMNLAFNAMLNGPQMFYMWEELGYDWSFCASSDGKSGDVDKGGTGCEETNAKPMPEQKGWYKDASRMAAYQKCGQIMQLRTKIMPSVFAGNPTSSDIGSGKALRSVIWGSGNDRVFIIGNFNVTGGTQYSGAKDFTLPTGNSWYDYLANGTTALPAGKSITLQPGEVKVYTASRKALPNVPNYYDFGAPTNADETTGYTIPCSVYPTVSSDFVTIDTEEEIKGVGMVGLNGSMYNCPLIDGKVANISHCAKGTYLLIVKFNNEQQAFRIIKN